MYIIIEVGTINHFNTSGCTPYRSINFHQSIILKHPPDEFVAQTFRWLEAPTKYFSCMWSPTQFHALQRLYERYKICSRISSIHHTENFVFVVYIDSKTFKLRVQKLYLLAESQALVIIANFIFILEFPWGQGPSACLVPDVAIKKVGVMAMNHTPGLRSVFVKFFQLRHSGLSLASIAAVPSGPHRPQTLPPSFSISSEDR